jgi:Spy/CpxP family protein refolding chaperone
VSRGWFLLLAVMVGLNAALLYDKFAPRGDERGPHVRRFRGEAPEWRGRFEGEPREMRERLIERRIEHLSESLGLSDEQRDAIRAIEHSTLEEIVDLRTQARAMRADIRKSLQAATVDSALVERLSVALHGIQGRIEAIVTHNLIREAAVLTPEQRERFLERPEGPPGSPEGPRRRGRR